MAGISISSLRYPVELTNTDWQKKKGTLAKMTKSGLGDSLTKTEAMFKNIDLQILDPAAVPAKTEEQLQARVTAAKAHYAKTVAPLMKEMQAVRGAAKEAAETLKKAIGGSTGAKAAEAVEKSASIFSVTLKSLDMEAAVKQVRADIAKKNELASKLLGQGINKFVVGAKEFLSAPSLPSWEKNIKQQGRSVSNSVAQLKAYNERFWTEFEKFKGFDTATLKLNETDPKVNEKMVALVKAAAIQVGKIAAYKP
jgi:hypothetical protein